MQSKYLFRNNPISFYKLCICSSVILLSHFLPDHHINEYLSYGIIFIVVIIGFFYPFTRITIYDDRIEYCNLVSIKKSNSIIELHKINRIYISPHFRYEVENLRIYLNDKDFIRIYHNLSFWDLKKLKTTLETLNIKIE